jgi:hypothetical protein
MAGPGGHRLKQAGLGGKDQGQEGEKAEAVTRPWRHQILLP